MKTGNTEVQTLHLNGWGVGDILEGVESSTHRILITAIGEEKFLCRWDYLNGEGFGEESGNTTLNCRDWYKVGEDAQMKSSAGFWGRVASNMLNKIKKLEAQIRMHNDKQTNS